MLKNNILLNNNKPANIFLVIMLKATKALITMKKIKTVIVFMVAAIFLAPKLQAQISVGISITARIAPPALPVYVQPACPVDGYLWQPGYWAWDNDAQDYYWVPGVWIAPPNPGLLWTPAYWGFEGGVYGFHAGYWGPHVGFYGGINYGFGYGGVGFGGGVWAGNSFRYNTAVVHVNNTVVHNTYIDRTVINNTTINNTTVNNRSSFNGPGGVEAKPRPEELAAMKEQHIPATAQQMQHEKTAHQDKSQFASTNHGQPAKVAMNKVGGAHFTAQGQKAQPANKMNAKSEPGGEKQAQQHQPKPQQAQQRHAQNHQQHAQKQPQQHRQAQPQRQPQREQASPEHKR
jgi:hypothetical protein